MKFNKIEIEELAMGSILHDIGQIVLPKSIYQKKERLTFQEFNIFKEHPAYGYKILKANAKLSPLSVHISFQHHERQDGGGYPRGLHGKNIVPTAKSLNPEKGLMHRFCEIVAVADAYDLLISPLFGMIKHSPEDAIKSLILASGTQLNREVVNALINITPIYPVGAMVIITAGHEKLIGCTAVVAQVRKQLLSKPIIIVTNAPNGSKIKPIKIDLLDNLHVKIKYLINRN